MIRLKISLRTSRLSSGTFKLRVNNLEDENFATNGILIQFLVLQSSLQLNSETNFFRARNDDSFQIWRLPPVHSKLYPLGRSKIYPCSFQNIPWRLPAEAWWDNSLSCPPPGRAGTRVWSSGTGMIYLCYSWRPAAPAKENLIRKRRL